MRGNVSLPIEIFCCYARSDLAFCEELKKHLTGLVRGGLLRIWFDGDISPGTAWEQEIYIRLYRSRIILLLISADFLASDYCYGKEMKLALERHHAGEARVVPILLRPVALTHVPFSHLQMLPTDARPITLWSNRDAAFENIAEGIRQITDELNGMQPPTPSAWKLSSPQPPLATSLPVQQMIVTPSPSFTLSELERIRKKAAWKIVSVRSAIYTLLLILLFIIAFMTIPAIETLQGQVLEVLSLALYLSFSIALIKQIKKDTDNYIRLRTNNSFSDFEALQGTIKEMKKDGRKTV